MPKNRLLIMLLLFLSLIIIPFVEATTITSCTFDKDIYNQGGTGYITATIYNDEEFKIRITELTATIDYYYYDGRVYNQKFETNATLPAEIQQGNSRTFYIPFSIPAYIASGYPSVYVKATAEKWNLNLENWHVSEHPTFEPILCIESPYQEQFADQVTINDQLESQLQEQLVTNKRTTNMMYIFGVTTLVFAAVTVLLFILNRRTRVFTRSIIYPE